MIREGDFYLAWLWRKDYDASTSKGQAISEPKWCRGWNRGYAGFDTGFKLQRWGTWPLHASKHLSLQACTRHPQHAGSRWTTSNLESRNPS